jgi:hypothetical protein
MLYPRKKLCTVFALIGRLTCISDEQACFNRCQRIGENRKGLLQGLKGVGIPAHLLPTARSTMAFLQVRRGPKWPKERSPGFTRVVLPTRIALKGP